MFTAAALLTLIGLTPGILALLGAPSIGALTALSVVDKVVLATDVVGLLPNHKSIVKLNKSIVKLNKALDKKFPCDKKCKVIAQEANLRAMEQYGWRHPYVGGRHNP